jgi:cytochrome c-type biogenesis protein CcmH
MILGFSIAILTAAVMAVLLWSVQRRGAGVLPEAGELERAVYRDQLAELERDADRGLIGPEEAAAARNEISRRLLQSAPVQPPPQPAGAGARASWAAVLAVPLIAVPLYLALGNPGLQDVPLAPRLAAAVDNKDMPALIRQVERQLEKKPDDLRGWQTLVPVYRSERRWEDAANAYSNIIRLSEPNAALWLEYADMLMFSGGGEIKQQAHDAVKRALALDPQNPKARFFDALAYKQQGKREEARNRLEALLAATPQDASYREAVENELKDLVAAKAPALTEEQMASVGGMSGSDQKQMIAGMIDGLEQRLGTTSTDLEGWLRLIRARSVNAEPDKAKASLATARTIFKDNTQALASLGSLANELGLAP